ncbi:MAG: ABC transporter ATP-binding protein [Gammaproteobacteria bacterium RIFOXYD12_FULL_61_37]|nr:MAG: ABC transporter ATP-binding protein [Gammaproteobacteria bacterium RIFOXYD12_FULL_61_37]
MPMDVPMVEVEGAGMVYGTGEAAVRALDGVDLAVRRGEMLALVGPSGSGKTTLLMILGCLLRPSAGEVRVDGAPVAGLAPAVLGALRLSRMGFIFQGYNLFPALTALENVQLALDLKGRDLDEGADLLHRVGLGARLNSYPRQLSGGEKQRVAVARALAGEPGIILADEPTAALDTANGLGVVELLHELAQAGRAVVVVTHDPRVAGLADRIVRIQDGRIAA